MTDINIAHQHADAREKPTNEKVQLGMFVCHPHVVCNYGHNYREQRSAVQKCRSCHLKCGIWRDNGSTKKCKNVK